MSTTGLEAFDQTIGTTNVWLSGIIARIGPDKQLAWRVLGAVLQVLRDRIEPELAAHLAAQLPLLVRGLYYDHYRPELQPTKVRTPQDFIRQVAEALGDIRPINPEDATMAVFAVLSEHLSAGLVSNVRQALPHSFASLWPQISA